MRNAECGMRNEPMIVTENQNSAFRIPAIRVKDLWKSYGVVEAVRGVSLEALEGEIFGLIGPDGAGKTTTFQILAGVLEADSGVAEVFGRPAREMRARRFSTTTGRRLSTSCWARRRSREASPASSSRSTGPDPTVSVPTSCIPSRAGRGRS